MELDEIRNKYQADSWNRIDRETLMNEVRNKLSTMGIKAK